MATIYDVAKVAGVSIATVSHVLNDRVLSPRRRAKVFSATQLLNYRPNCQPGPWYARKRTIGLIVPDNANPFFAELARIENHGLPRL